MKRLKRRKKEGRKLRQPCAECGGEVRYVEDFGRKFAWCEGCTPVVRIEVRRVMP